MLSLGLSCDFNWNGTTLLTSASTLFYQLVQLCPSFLMKRSGWHLSSWGLDGVSNSVILPRIERTNHEKNIAHISAYASVLE